MIHLIEIDVTVTPEKLRKLARQKAMTGGFELEIKSSLSVDELGQILGAYIEELSLAEGSPRERLSSNAGRVLCLLKEHPNLSAEQRALIENLLERLK